MDKEREIDAILACLPQTQCGECGFPGCKPYAEAIVLDRAAINLCPPGGLETLQDLAALTHQYAKPLEAALSARIQPKRIAQIREDECIGCTKCVQACPVDAIYGTAKQMHVVLSEACTGCTLCVAPCPVDCIDMISVPVLNYNKTAARAAYEAKLARNDFKRAGRMLALADPPTQTQPSSALDRKRFISEAVARFKAKK